MTDVRELGPLDYRIAITDQQGRPSPEFQRRWDAQRINNGLFITLTFGMGAPTDPADRDGSEYIDTSTTPYTLYVVRTGAWHKVGPYAFTDLSDVPHSYSGSALKLVRVNAGETALEFSTIAAALDSIGSVQGDILYRNATGWTVLPPGTASQLLQTGGASANPSWVNAPTSLPSIANNTLLANTSGSAAVPVSTTLTALIDSALGSAQGDIIYRNASGWVVLTPGTSGYLLTTGGASANPSWTAPIAAANPTATASDTAINGSASTFMRSDASPAIQKATSGQFGVVKVDGTTLTSSSGVISVVGTSISNPLILGGVDLRSGAGVPPTTDPNGSLYLRSDIPTAYLTVNSGTPNPTRVQEITAGGTYTATLPGSPTAGNTYIAFCHNSTAYPTASSGWTKFSDNSGNFVETYISAFWKRVASGDSATQTPAAGSAGTPAGVAIIEVSGLSPTFADNPSFITWGGATLTGSTVNANSLLISFAAWYGSGGTAALVQSGSGWTNNSASSNGGANSQTINSQVVVSSGGSYTSSYNSPFGFPPGTCVLGLKASTTATMPLSFLTTVKNSGTTIDSNVASLNFSGSTATTDGHGNITVTASGSVTTTGSPASGNLTKFSGASTVTNADLTGDVTTSGGVATTLASSGVTAATYGDSTHVPQIIVDAKGRITSASNVTISGGGGGGGTVIGSTQVISEVTTSGSQSSVTISVPSTYRDLKISISGRSQLAATLDESVVQFNSDTGANYDYFFAEQPDSGSLGVINSYAGSFIYLGQMPAATATANMQGRSETTIGNYANISFYKQVQTLSGYAFATSAPGQRYTHTTGTWKNTAAITTLTIKTSSGSAFVDGTVITVYGIGGTPAPITSVTSGLTLISSQTLAATAASVSFNSIPQSYQDLVLVTNAATTESATNSAVKIQLNGDTGANYDYQYSSIQNASLSSTGAVAQTSGQIGFAVGATGIANTAAMSETTFAAYANTTFHKQFVSLSGIRTGTTTSTVLTNQMWNDWRSAAAISSMSVIPGGGSWAAGSTFQLYGRGGANVTINPQPGLPVISETVTSGSQSSVTVSGIPSTYRDLMVVVSGRGDTASTLATLQVQLNGDTGSNYDTVVDNLALTLTASNTLAGTFIDAGYLNAATGPASVGTSTQFVIHNYAGTTFQKDLVADGTLKTAASSGNIYRTTRGGWWRSTAAVTSVKVYLSAGNFVDGTVITVYGIGGSPTATLPVIPPQGRLTLTSGAPVMTADATAQGTIYYAPYVGTLLPVGNIMYRFSQLSYVLNTTAHTSTNLYDVFAYNSSGTITLATGPAWTNSTTRSNAISMDATNGIWVNTSSITLNLSGGTTTTTVAAGQATYLGTFYATANGQTGMAFAPTAASGGTNNILGLSNAYNRVNVFAMMRDSAASWTVSNTSWAATNASNSNRISFVDGLQQSQIRGAYSQYYSTTAVGKNVRNGMSLDSTTATPQAQARNYSVTNAQGQLVPEDRWHPQLGFHYIQAQQFSDDAANTTTFIGSGLMSMVIDISM